MKILIPLDGSDISQHTVDWVCRTFEPKTHTFYLLVVLAEPMIAEYKLEDAMETLNKTKAQLEGCGLSVAKAEYLTGEPVHRICQYADEEAIEQIFMGSHGRTGIIKALLGSVSQGVMEHSKQPVSIYRHHVKKPAAVQ